MLQLIYSDLTNDSIKSDNKDLDKRALKYCTSKGNDDLYPDLRAAMNGSKEMYTKFYSVAEQIIDEISGAQKDRNGEKNYITAHCSDLTSISALYDKIKICMKTNDDVTIVNAPLPSLNLLRISLCPQYESRAISKNFTCRFNLTRAIEMATMRKNNIDSHYNHKINQYGNAFILELNEKVYKYLENVLPYPNDDNDLIFSKGITKISVDDKGAVPVGEPNCPVRTNVRKLHHSLIPIAHVAQPTATDHDFHKANIRPSVSLFIYPPNELRKLWRRGVVSICNKDGAIEHSTAMRHSLELTQQIKMFVKLEKDILCKEYSYEEDNMPYSFLIRSDGGHDRNPRNASVQIGCIYNFLQNDLDFVIYLITAPDVSHVNEVEGVMPVANIALQNQAYCRETMSHEMEYKFKKQDQEGQLGM